MTTLSLKMPCFRQQYNKTSHQKYKFLSFSTAKRSIVSTMATCTIYSAIGISETFTRLKRQGKVSLTGVTGYHPNVNLQVQALLQEIKEATTKPVVVGFGLSTPEHVKQVARWGADGAIVGSAIMKLLGKAKSPEEGLKQIEIFNKSLKAALP